jgi:Protein of unknown function (DUF3592)
MKAFKIIGILCCCIGIAALIGFVFSIIHTNRFIAESVLTKGEVVDIVTHTSTDSHGRTTRSRYPVVKFLDKNGDTVEFESSASTSGGIKIGQPIDVRFIPNNPSRAKLANSFMDIWGLTVFCGIFGVVFAGLGFPFFWLGIRDDINEKKAQLYAKEIEVPIKGIVKNTSITMNGRSPFQIEAQWLNPETNQVHIFKSKNIWYDPSEYCKGTVIIKADPQNLKKYWMDISFLPKKA